MSTSESMPDNAVDVNGWDIVYATDFASLNAAIAAANTSPRTFQQTFTGARAQGMAELATVSASGSFSTWSLTPGGAGALAFFALPISAGSLSINGQTYDLAGAIVTAQLGLTFQAQLPASGGAQPFSGGTHHALCVDPSTAPVVVSVGLTGADAVVSALASQLFAAWLSANAGSFSQIFATAVTGATASNPEAQWLMPTVVSYSVVDDASASGGGVLALLALAGSDSVPGGQQASPGLLPAGAHTGLAIGYRAMLTNMVLPAATLMFPDATPAQFAVVEDGTEIQNLSDVTIQIADTTSGNTYTATIGAGNFAVVASAAGLQIEISDMSYAMGGGTADVHLWYGMGL